MTTTRMSIARRELRFDAGSPALNLAATLGRRGSGGDSVIERLAGPADLARWCAGVGLTLDPAVDMDALLDEMRELREQVYAVASQVLLGKAAASDTLVLLNRHAAHPVPAAQFALVDCADAPVTVQEPHLDVPQVVSSIVRDLLELVGSDRRRSRLRACDADDCRMLFELPPGTRERRWCSMSRCGNRAKAARHRRLASQRGPDVGRARTDG